MRAPTKLLLKVRRSLQDSAPPGRRVVEDADPYRACAYLEKDAQCAPLQSVQRRCGSRCRIPRLTARRVVEDADPYRVRQKIRVCTGGTPGTAFPTGD